MTITNQLLLGSLLLAGGLVIHSTAQACSPPMPGLYGTVPEQGATYPGNAAVFFSGYEMSLDKVVATVDGTPATLTQISNAPGFYQDRLMATVTPTPQAGQTVVISGNFCWDDFYDDYFCEPKSLSYVAGAHDFVAPEASLDVRYDVHEHPDREPSNSCESYSDATIYVRLRGTPAQPGESPVLVTVNIYDHDAVPNLVLKRQVTLRGEEQTVEFELSGSQLGWAPLEQLPVQVSITDAAGNALGEGSVAAACKLSKETPKMTDGFSWSEPDWSKAQAVEGGPCWDDAVSPNGGPIVISSCSTRLSSGPSPLPPYAWTLVAAGLFIGLRRRREGG